VPELWSLVVIERHMNFTRLPETREQWKLTFERGCVSAGFVILLAQTGVRFFLAGLRRQNIEEILSPYLLVMWLLLLFCTVDAFRHRERLLGITAGLLGIISGLIALLPILLREGVYD
jgi:hypothetical protein